MTASTLHAAAPVWPSAGEAARVEAELRRRPGLVRPADCASLRDGLARVAAGEAYLVQGGDCAELFAEVSARTTARKCAQLHELAGLLGRPVVRVGRLAGQFAKPRSHPTEPGADGTPLPVYRGDAVNGLAPADRVPDPRRMLTAYELSAQVLSQLAGHLAGRGVYTSHEALLPGYEDGLTRTDPATGTRYGSSGHLLWIGDRTRHPDGRHVELLAGLSNPVAVKLGPTATSADVAALVDRLDPHRVPGRLVLVPRLGADRVRELLPALVAAVRDAGARPAWVCDPMHGNTVEAASGHKTRYFDDVLDEVAGFFEVHRALGTHPGGIHIEFTGDDVTECIGGGQHIAESDLRQRYETACDPRLNRSQSLDLAFRVADRYRPFTRPDVVALTDVGRR